MKNYLRIFSVFFVCLSIMLSSCEKEEDTIENPPVTESIEAGSELAILMQRAAIEDRSFDDFIDLADCLSINLPFTINVNDVSITINSENDYENVIALIAKFNNKYDLEIIYPIVITLNDYTQVVINAEEELIPYVESCLEMDEDIPCIEFVFPVSFSVYNIEFELIDTIEINSNEELYLFIENIEAGTLVSLNFPVQMQLQNGEVIEVNSNEEIQAAIEAAELECNMMNQTEFGCYEFIISDQGCDDDGDGEATFVIDVINTPENQEECIELLPFSLTIHLTIEDAINGVLAPGILFDEPVELASQTLYGRIERIATGDFEIQALELVVEACDVDEETDFGCFDGSVNDVLITCVNSSVETAVFDLTAAIDQCEDPDVFDITYHLTEADAVSNQSAIPVPFEYNLESPYTDNIIFIRVTSIQNPDEFRIYSQFLIVENCNDLICDDATLNQYLEECAWVTNGSISFILEFNNGIVTATVGNSQAQGSYSTAIFNIESSGQFFSQFTISGFTGDFAILNNTYEVGFCSFEVLNLHSLDPANNLLPFDSMELDCSAGCDNPGFLTEDLVIYMPFANEMKDLISGYEINNPPVFFTQDRAGNPNCAAFFDGDAASLPMNAQNAIINEDSFSVSLWFKMENTNAGDLERFIQKGDNDAEGFSVGVYDLNTPLAFSENPPFNLWDDDWNGEVDVAWENQDWHHLVITRSSGSDTVQLWRDGILRNTGEGMNIGQQQDGFYFLGENFLGVLDDLRVYKRALNGNEINQLYNLEADCFTCL